MAKKLRPGWRGYDQDSRGCYQEYRHKRYGTVIRYRKTAGTLFKVYPKNAIHGMITCTGLHTAILECEKNSRPEETE